MADNDDRSAELIQRDIFFFEVAKHFTTLNTASILVLLTLGDRVNLPLWLIAFFGLSLAGATVSMLVTGLRGTSQNSLAPGNLGMAVAVAFFFVGLLYSFLHAAVLPAWLTYVVLIGVFVVAVAMALRTTVLKSTIERRGRRRIK